MEDAEKTQEKKIALGLIGEDSKSLPCRACYLEDKEGSRGQG